MSDITEKSNQKWIDRTLLRVSEKMSELPGYASRRRWHIFIVFFLFTLLSAFGLTKVKFDQSMDSFFVEDDPAIREYDRFRFIFGSDENILIMYAPTNGDVFSRESLQRVHDLEKFLNRKRLDADSPFSRITRIRSIVSADYLESRGDTLYNRKFIGDNLPKAKKDSDRLRALAMKHKEYPGSFFSRDFKQGTIILETSFGARIKKKEELNKKRETENNSIKVTAKNRDNSPGNKITESKSDKKTLSGSSKSDAFDFGLSDKNNTDKKKIAPDIQKKVSGSDGEEFDFGLDGKTLGKKESDKKSVKQKGSKLQRAASSSGEETARHKFIDIYDIKQIPELESMQMEDYQPIMAALRKELAQRNWSNTSLGEKRSPVMDYTVAGNPWLMDFFASKIMSDMGIVMSLSILLIVLVLWIAFRSFAATLWPSLIVILSIIWTVGLVGLFGVVMSMMVNIIIFLNLTVGIAASIHILSGYRFFTIQGLSKEEALKATFLKSGVSISLAAFTTMAGLLSLLVVPIMPIKNFAFTAALGVFFTLVAALVLLPAFMHYYAPKLSDKKEKGNHFEKHFQNILERVNRITLKYRITIVIVFFIIAAISLSAYNRVLVDTSMAKMVKKGYGITEAYNAIDKYFGGTNSVEILLDTGVQDGMKDPRIVTAINGFAKEILSQESDFVARIQGMHKIAKESYKTLTDGSDKNYRIPQDSKVLAQTFLNFESADPQTRRLVVDDDWRIGRISLQVYSKSSHEYEKFVQDLNEHIEKYFSPLKEKFPLLKVQETGGILIMMKLMSYISVAQLKSFGLVLLVVSVILLILYGSLKFGIIAMLPNLFPIALLVGIIGWFRIPLDSDTLLVMPIAIGIAVDDTIHFLTHYKTELLRGSGQKEALRTALKEVGQAMIFTSLVLSIGFLVFLISSYIPLNNYGFLSALAILSALLADLFFLPALILIVSPLSKDEKAKLSIS